MTIVTETPQATTIQAGESDHSLSPLLPFPPSHFLLAAVAVMSGAIAGGALSQGGLPFALMALVLAGAWLVLWSALARVNWQPARAAWRDWSRGTPSRHLPYTQAGSDSDKVSRDLSQFGAWLRGWLLPRHGVLLGMALAAFMVMLALAMALGVPAMLLSVGVLVLIQVALALCGGSGKPAVWSEGFAVIGLPFALGVLALTPSAGPAAWPIALACLAMGLALMAIFAGDGLLLHVGGLLAVVAFVLLREPAAAFVMGIAWATTALLKPAVNHLALIVLCLIAVALALAL